MKVCIISDYLPEYHKIWSGAELIAMTLSDMLKSRGVDVFFLTTSFDFSPANNREDIYPVRTPLKKLGAISRNFPIDVGAIRHIHRILKEKKPDVVHINAKYLFLPTVIACLRLKIPTVFTVPDYFILCPHSFIRKPDGSICSGYQGSNCYECLSILGEGILKKTASFTPRFLMKTLLALRAKEFKYFIKKVTAYVVLTRICEKRLIDYGIPEEKVRVIYHYRVAAPKETVEDIKNPSAVFVGWLSEENGADKLIRAFALVLREVKNAKLYLVGTGTDSFVKSIKAEIAELEISDNVFFLGKKDNAETLSILSKCDVVAVPHQWPKEFGPVILVEALAMGKPVITSRIGATEEFIEDGVNGFLIDDHGNHGKFAEKLKYLLGDLSVARVMGERAREVGSFFCGDAASGELMSLYGHLINSNR